MHDWDIIDKYTKQIEFCIGKDLYVEFNPLYPEKYKNIKNSDIWDFDISSTSLTLVLKTGKKLEIPGQNPYVAYVRPKIPNEGGQS